jgi:mono/diheme cytochrome c family protein
MSAHVLPLVALVGIAIAAPAALGQQPDRAKAIAAGKALHEKDCAGCHAKRFDGDPARIYLRPDRRVNTPAQLKAQVAFCNTQLGAGLFPEDEEHIALYLDQQYYKFKP